MKRLRLANTSLEVSALGFGCVSLTTHADPRDARALLDLAYESGITHFDTARVYGQGQSEAILGEFIRDKRDRVTVATKCGLQSTLPGRDRPGLLRMAKSFLRTVPPLESFVKRRVGSFAKGGAFTVPEARASLEASLRALKTDYVDILLLHEATREQAANEDLTGFLASEIARGTIRSAGIGSDYRNLRGDVTDLAPTYQVLQFANGAYTPTLSTIDGLDRRAVITHSALEGLAGIQRLANANDSLARTFSDRVSLDLRDAGVLARLGLQYALHANPGGIVLFGTMRREHLIANVRNSSMPIPSEQVSAFAEYVELVRSAANTPSLSV